MFTASVLAETSDVPIFTVRHYTRIGLLHPKRHQTNNYQVYHSSDEARLNFIVTAKELGFTLNEIKKILDEAGNGHSPCPMVRDIIEKRISETAGKIKQLQELQSKMKKARKDWAKMEDALPNGHSVCHLIESIAD